VNAIRTRCGLKENGAPALLALYKRVVSPVLHAAAGGQAACRFQPTCSEYAAIAIAGHGVMRGALMALGRLLRCHPLHCGGFDPVPPKRSASGSCVRAPQIP
jgi:uncharacterized protein